MSGILLTSGLTKRESATDQDKSSVQSTETTKFQSQNPAPIDEAVSLTIKAQSKGYGSGEVSTEGHIILDSEDTDGNLKVYTIASFGAFGFENGIFTKISGSGAIPTVITFSKSEKGEYSLLEYKEPMSGDGYHQSKKDMFPQRLWDKVLSEQEYYPDLAKQQEEQAKQYLQSIGRNAEVSAASLWMERQIEISDFVLIVCTKSYFEKIEDCDPNNGKGAIWEIGIVRQALYESYGLNSKFIPIVFDEYSIGYIPKPLKVTTYYNVSRVKDLKKLSTRILGIESNRKPPVFHAEKFCSFDF